MNPRQRRPQKGNIEGFITPSIKPLNSVEPPKLTKPEVPETPIATSFKPDSQESQPDFPRYYSPYAGQTRSNRQVRPKKKKSLKRKALKTVVLMLLIGFGIGSWYGARIIGSIDKVLHGNIFSDVHALFSNTKLKGEAQGRVNILLAGDSADDPGHAGANLTDSIMIVSIDTQKHTGFMLSVPRDLWVDIPGQGHEKINAANEATSFSQSGFPHGGMGQLEQIAQTDLGIPIDYYALIDYSAFKSAVNAIGGIKINLQSPDPRGIYDAYTNLRLPNGWINLDGQQALNLARARGDNADGDISYGLPNSDFDRTTHQRQMLTALAQKAQSVGVVANPIKVSQLFSSVSNNIQTDLNLQDMLRFAQITKGMDITHLQSLSYQYGGTNSLLKSYLSPDGQLALIPTAGVDEFGGLRQYYQQLTSNNPVVREAPSVVILNGNNVTGLARKESTTLSSEGFNVVGVADTSRVYTNSLIVDLSNNQKPASKQLLQTLLPRGVSIVTTASGSTQASEAQGYNANFVIVLGQDSSNVQQP